MLRLQLLALVLGLLQQLLEPLPLLGAAQRDRGGQRDASQQLEHAGLDRALEAELEHADDPGVDGDGREHQLHRPRYRRRAAHLELGGGVHDPARRVVREDLAELAVGDRLLGRAATGNPQRRSANQRRAPDLIHGAHERASMLDERSQRGAADLDDVQLPHELGRDGRLAAADPLPVGRGRSRGPLLGHHRAKRPRDRAELAAADERNGAGRQHQQAEEQELRAIRELVVRVLAVHQQGLLLLGSGIEEVAGV